MALNPSLPNTLSAKGLIDQPQKKDHHQESAPSDGVNPDGNCVTLVHATIDPQEQLTIQVFAGYSLGFGPGAILIEKDRILLILGHPRSLENPSWSTILFQ
jgi:hypothetical protein